MILLGVNIDHVATIREARKTYEPDPVTAAVLAELGGADGITIHLREDRRHIQDRDLRLLRETVHRKLNLEMAVTQEMVRIALEVRPDQVTFVPERREEVTTEGGLDVLKESEKIERAVEQFRHAEIPVSIFVDPDIKQIHAIRAVGAQGFEIHTGSYANARGEKEIKKAFRQIYESAIYGDNVGLRVYAGHGLNYRNIMPLKEIKQIEEVNIGHSIMSRAIFVGLERAVREMKALLD
jgi:pyridoxine 5-phosphate synthase